VKEMTWHRDSGLTIRVVEAEDEPIKRAARGTCGNGVR
jgi:hypothetical protein